MNQPTKSTVSSLASFLSMIDRYHPEWSREQIQGMARSMIEGLSEEEKMVFDTYLQCKATIRDCAILASLAGL